MAKAVFYHDGENLDYLNGGESLIEPGDVIAFGNKIAVAGGLIMPNEVGAVVSEGVFKMVKTSGNEIKLGTPVFFDAEKGEISTEKTGIPAGIATADAAASDVVVLVDISAGAAAIAAVEAGKASTS